MTEQEAAAAEEKVLFPEASAQPVTLTVYPDPQNPATTQQIVLKLRPLPIKYARQLALILKKVTANANAPEKDAIDATVELADVITDALMVMMAFYGTGLSREAVESSLTDGQIKNLVNRQVEIDDGDGFLRNLWARVLEGVAAMMTEMKKPVELPSPNPVSTPPSVQNGAVPSTSLSPDIPEGSSFF